jgi:hypothetical protein
MAALPRLSGRVLGLFGSDQDITYRQLRACGGTWLRLSGQAGDRDLLVSQLERDGLVMARLDMPCAYRKSHPLGLRPRIGP